MRKKMAQKRAKKQNHLCKKLTCREEEDAEEGRSKVLAARQREREETQTQVSFLSLTINNTLPTC